MVNSGIYAIYFSSAPDKFYIGRSTNLRTRLLEHSSSLLAGRHINRKLQNFYNKYRDPNFVVLEYAEPHLLKQLEIDYINEFNSYHDGLNLTNGGENCGFGEGVHSAKHKESDYIKVLMLLANTNLTCAQVAQEACVSRDIVKAISCGAAHGYLESLFPKEYALLKSKKYTRDNSAESKGITYPVLLSPSGIEYVVNNIHEFCRLHNLQPQNLHKVLTRQRRVHKGWVLK